MPIHIIKVLLTLKERARLEAILKSKKTTKKDQQKAEVLLLTDIGEHGPKMSPSGVVNKLGLSSRSVGRIREAYSKNSSIDDVFRFANLSDQTIYKPDLVGENIHAQQDKKKIKYVEVDNGEADSFLIENVKCRVILTKEDREQLDKISKGGKHTTRKSNRAKILLLADEGSEGPAMSDQDIANKLDVSLSTVARVRKIFITQGDIDTILNFHHNKAGRLPKIDGTVQATLIAQVCSKPPEGRSTWTVRLLADQLVALEVVESISHTAVSKALKKMNLSLGNEKNG